jgi:hypothetical protein
LNSVAILTVMPGDLIISRGGERGSDCFFIILTGSVKVAGKSERGAHEIYAADEFPFFGVAEILAKDGHADADHKRLSHRSVVATAMCDMARIHRQDWCGDRPFWSDF